jgi:signal transduction histidine kinase
MKRVSSKGVTIGNVVDIVASPSGRILVGGRHISLNVRIDVYDTGIGITRDEIGRMFEASTRLDPARQDEPGMVYSSRARQSQFWDTA